MLLKVMEDFISEYNLPPMDSYISYFDLSTIGKFDEDAEEDDRDKPCIVVKLREPLPRGKDIPDLYRGVKVIVI